MEDGRRIQVVAPKIYQRWLLRTDPGPFAHERRIGITEKGASIVAGPGMPTRQCAIIDGNPSIPQMRYAAAEMRGQ